MNRLISLLIIGVALYYGYQTGILESLISGFEPKVDKDVVLRGPLKEGVDVAASKETARVFIDSFIGRDFESRMAGGATRRHLLQTGDVVKVAEKTKAKVMANSKVMCSGAMYPVTQVEILNGPAKGGVGWVDRWDVVDNPMLEFYQMMRQVEEKQGEDKKG